MEITELGRVSSTMQTHFMTFAVAPLLLCACSAVSLTPSAPARAFAVELRPVEFVDAPPAIAASSAAFAYEPLEQTPKAKAPPAKAPQKKIRAPREGKRNEITITHERVKFDTITLDAEDSGLIFPNGTTKQDFHDVKQTLTKIRYRFGGNKIGFVVGLVGEETDDEISGADPAFDLVGIEFGCDGFPHLGPEKEINGALDYSAGLSFRGGRGDLTIDDGSGSGPQPVDTDIFEAELALRLGVGVDVRGVQLSTGIVASALAAVFDNDVVNSSFSARGFNAGGYVRAWFRSDKFPLVGGFQLVGGDIRGASVGIGVRF